MKVTSWCFRSLVWIPFLCCLPVFGQVEITNWVFGDSVHLRFRTGAAPIITRINTPKWMTECSSAYTYPDSVTGLFAGFGNDTDLTYLASAWTFEHHRLIPGYMKGDQSASNGSLVVPFFSSSDSLFYVFSYQTALLYYAVIRKNTSGYTLLNMDNILYPGSYFTEHVSAVRKPNQKDWWVLTHAEDDQNAFLVFEITSAGIAFVSKQYVGQIPINWVGNPYFNNGFVGLGGDLAISPDGERIAICGSSGYLNLFEFDRCSGLINNPIVLSISPMVIYTSDSSSRFWSVAFSPDSKKLYVNDKLNFIYQYDLTASNIAASRQMIYQDDTTDCIALGNLELGPDNRIYLAGCYDWDIHHSCPMIDSITTQSRYLSVIHAPDSLGAACRFQPWSLYLNGRRSFYGLPNFPNYRAPGIDSADAGPDTWYCPGGAPVPIGSPPKSGQVFAWSPVTGLSDPTAPQPLASPSVPTLYVLTVTDTNAHVSCNVTTDSVWVWLESPSAYTPTPLHDTVTCLNAVITLGADSIPGFVYTWNPATGLSNANSPRPRTTVTDTVLYVLTVHDPAFHSDCGTWSDSLTVMPDTGCIAPHTDNPLEGRSLGAFFPNPGSGTFFLDHDLQPGDVLSITCTDLTGREVSCSWTASGSHRHLLTLDVPAGVYLAEIKLNNLPVRRVKLMVE